MSMKRNNQPANTGWLLIEDDRLVFGVCRYIIVLMLNDEDKLALSGIYSV